MASIEPATDTTTTISSTDDKSLKLAVAISLLRSKLLQKQAVSSSQNPSTSQSDALRWKRKAKERKQELLRLREDLKEAEDASLCDVFPQTASCKCYFFDNLGKLSHNRVDGPERRFNDVLRRRFLRQVRLKQRRKGTNKSSKQLFFSDVYSENEVEQLRASIDFLVDLCDTTSAEEANFANWSHQAVDFILASSRNLLSGGNNMELIEGIVSSLISRLVRKMCCHPSGDESGRIDTDAQFYIQHLIRKLGCEPYIGQRALLSVSQRISMIAENLLFMDPFDNAFPNLDECLFIMIQLIEFLISDYLLAWSSNEDLDDVLFEEWVTSVLRARKALELVESRNGLYVLYMDRVAGELAKHAGQVLPFQKLSQDMLEDLFC